MIGPSNGKETPALTAGAETEGHFPGNFHFQNVRQRAISWVFYLADSLATAQ